MIFKYLLAAAAFGGLSLAGHAQAATAPKDLAACVWEATSDAERTAMISEFDRFITKGESSGPAGESYGQFSARHPSASVAIDGCRDGASTPALWKGHFISSLAMEHWAASQLKTKQNIDSDRLDRAWDKVPDDVRVCFGIMTAWAISETDKTAEPYLSSLPLKTCGQDGMKAAMPAFLKDLQLDPQSDAAKTAGMYAFGKGGETVVIDLMTAAAKSPPPSVSN